MSQGRETGRGTGRFGAEAVGPAPSLPDLAAARRLFETSSAIVVLTDSEGRVLLVSEALQDVTGYRPDEVVGRSAFDLFLPPRFHRLGRRVFQNTLAGRTPRVAVVPFTRRDGREIEIRWRGTAVEDVGEGEAGILVVGEDVTEDRRRDAWLRFTQFAVDKAGDGAFWMDAEGRLVYVNEAACRSLGYARSELLAMSVHDIDLDFTRERWREHWATLRQEGSIVVASRHRTKDGRVVPVEVTANHVRFGAQEYNCAFARDVSERERAEAAVREGERQFATVVNAVREAVIGIDAGGRIRLWNRAAEDMFGWRRDEVLGGSLDRLLPASMREAHRGHVRRYFESGRPGPAFQRQLEVTALHRSGRSFPMEISLTEALLEGGRFVIGVARDVTERHQALQALRASEERLDMVIRGAGLGLWDWDLRTGIITHNERWAEMLGYALAEVEGTFAAWQDRIHTEDRQRARAALEAHLEGDTPVYESEYRMRARDGRWVWIHDRGRVLERDEDGRPVRAAGTHLDVTERRRAADELARTQALLRAAIDQTPAGILVADAPDVRIRLANAAALGIRGDTKRPLTDIPVERHPLSWKTFHPDGTPYAPEDLPLSRAVLRGETVRNEEVIIRRHGGEDRWVLANASPVHDAEGRVVAGIVVFPDITERKKGEAEQRALEEKVREAQKYESLGVLAGGIAHDFNNLLTGVLGHADLALPAASGDPRLQAHLEGIATAATRAADLCRQLLAYSGRGQFVIERLDLHRLIREMGDLLEVSIPKGARITYAFAQDLRPVQGDATQLQQVVMNLITNASEALPEGGGHIRVRTLVEDLSASDLRHLTWAESLEPGPCVCIEVADDGHGMSEETKARIFDPFFTTKFAGRGLGLAAVQGIVRGHRGGIHVHSRRGGGTTFRVLLPVVEGRLEAPAETTAVASTPWQGQGTVLVVDDEPSVREVLGLFLESAGFEVLKAVDGVEALEIFKAYREEIVLVVLDLTMPRMDGVDTYRALRALRPGVRVVVTSGYSEEELVVRFGEDRPTSFVQKPCRSTQLLEAVRAAL